MTQPNYKAISKWIDNIVESSTTAAHLKCCDRLLDLYQDLIIRHNDSSLWVSHHTLRNKIFTKRLSIKV